MNSEQLHELVAKIEKKANDTYAMLSNAFLEIERLKDLFSGVFKDSEQKVATKDFQSHVQGVQDKLSNLGKEVFSLCDHKDALKAFLRIFKEDVDKVQSSIKDQESKHVVLSKGISDLVDSVQKARHDLDFNMNYTVGVIKENLNARMDGFSLSKDALTLDQVEAHFKKFIESLSLDVSNASIKSKNNDARLDIVEKKLENVSLKMASQDLSSK